MPGSQAPHLSLYRTVLQANVPPSSGIWLGLLAQGHQSVGLTVFWHSIFAGRAGDSDLHT